MVKELSYSITGVGAGDLESVNITDAYNSPSTGCVLSVYDTTLDLGDTVTAELGYGGSNTKVFTGYVQALERSIPNHIITITCEDVLTRAVNYFIAADDPQNPLTYSNISSQDYIESVLALAGITNFEANVPLTFTWGTDAPAEVNLISAWQAADEMANMLAWHIYADRNGKVWFTDRRPYDQGGDTASYSYDETAGTNVLSLSYQKSTEELRNRVVVYGREGIQASASLSSPYLYSSTYYKTAVVAHPLIQTASQAQTTADYNLELYNRLTQIVSMTVEGDPTLEARQFVNITGSSFTTVTGMWFLYSVRHKFGPQGYTVDLHCTK
jgi:hypothetical protein